MAASDQPSVCLKAGSFTKRIVNRKFIGAHFNLHHDGHGQLIFTWVGCIHSTFKKPRSTVCRNIDAQHFTVRWGDVGHPEWGEVVFEATGPKTITEMTDDEWIDWDLEPLTGEWAQVGTQQNGFLSVLMCGTGLQASFSDGITTHQLLCKKISKEEFSLDWTLPPALCRVLRLRGEDLQEAGGLSWCRQPLAPFPSRALAQAQSHEPSLRDVSKDVANIVPKTPVVEYTVSCVVTVIESFSPAVSSCQAAVYDMDDVEHEDAD